MYRQGLGALDPEESASLRGLISYVQSVDPLFVAALQRKFGPDLNGIS